MSYNSEDYIDFMDFLNEVYEVEGIGIMIEIGDNFITHLIPHYPYDEPMFELSFYEDENTITDKAKVIMNERIVPFMEMNLRTPLFKVIVPPGAF